MKIVHVVEPFSGGIATFLKLLVEQLSDDIHIVVHGERKQEILSAEVKRQFKYGNVKFLRWRSAQRSLRLKDDIAATIELYQILKRLKESGKLDVVHLHSSKGGFIGRMVCRMLGLQHTVIYTPNGAPFLGSGGMVSNYVYQKLEQLATTFGGQVVCCSASEQNAYEKAGIHSLMINNGTRHKTGRTLRKSTGERDRFRVVTSGRIAAQKNPGMFNQIAHYFKDLGQFEFIWAGDGSDSHLLDAPNITITGWLNQDQVNEIVAEADLYLSTSNFEGLPFAVLEALALKKPVLLSDCVGNKDLVMEGLNGSVFSNAADAITKILHFHNNKNMLGIMGEYSGMHCKKTFDQADTGRLYRMLYQKVTAGEAS